MPDRDYSHRSFIDKLGVTAGQKIALVNVRDDPFVMVITQATGAKPATALRGTYDRIFLQIDHERDLDRIAKARDHLRPEGALWIFHPKGKNATVKDARVREVYLANGLVDNKVSAYTETHTATRCVIPVSLRPA
ncbi:MAG: DUF3052 family protein [Candidatus Eremiobacteraeota bacterium]|nr:DUF3052 family protein [Candidatus Eremiobacteraeota bacterium]